MMLCPTDTNEKILKAMLQDFLEAPPGIGPGIRVLQTRALPLGHGAKEIADTFFASADGADYGARTRHLDLGKVALYQMS